jgi:hypothetical protein
MKTTKTKRDKKIKRADPAAVLFEHTNYVDVCQLVIDKTEAYYALHGATEDLDAHMMSQVLCELLPASVFIEFAETELGQGILFGMYMAYLNIEEANMTEQATNAEETETDF